MFDKDQAYIIRQGWTPILVVFLAGTLLYFTMGLLWSIPFWAVSIILLFLFRNPKRQIPSAPLGVVSPVDGYVLDIDKIHDPYLDRDAVAVLIEIARFGPYVMRGIIEGKIVERFGLEANQHAMWIQTDEQDDLVIESTMTSPMSRARCYAQTGERIGQGQRCGFLYFRPNIRVLMPANTRIEVKIGDKVMAGTNIIATLVHS